MRTKTFRFLKAPDAGMLALLQRRLVESVREQVPMVRIDLSSCPETPPRVLEQIEAMAEELRDRLNQGIEVIPPTPPEAEADAPATSAPLPRPDGDGTAEIRLADHGIIDLDLARTDRFLELTRAVHGAGARHIFLNFSGVRSLNAGGIMTLVRLKRELARTGGELMLLIPDDSRVYDIIRANNLTEEFRIGFTR